MQQYKILMYSIWWCFCAESTDSDTIQGENSNTVARPVGEGVYSLVRHHTAVRTSTHLVYKLENPGPHKKHQPQDALNMELNIEPQASFVIQVSLISTSSLDELHTTRIPLLSAVT